MPHTARKNDKQAKYIYAPGNRARADASEYCNFICDFRPAVRFKRHERQILRNCTGKEKRREGTFAL